MMKRQQIVKQAQEWLGRNEADGTHKHIIDVYNGHRPLARGYKVKYTDAWCATFVSAVSIACGATEIMPTECGCPKMIELYKKLGAWVEKDDYIPSPGDVVFYDWDDNGKGDNIGEPEHVGIVEEVKGSLIIIIEGNYKNAVSRRNLAVNGRYIRGYGVPKYAVSAITTTTTKEKKVMVELTQLRKGATGNEVKTLQRLLSALGYKMENNGKVYGVDGSFGTATYNAVIKFQKAKGLEPDGIVGKLTWTALLK
jgi:hypothetical protein